MGTWQVVFAVVMHGRSSAVAQTTRRLGGVCGFPPQRHVELFQVRPKLYKSPYTRQIVHVVVPLLPLARLMVADARRPQVKVTLRKRGGARSAGLKLCGRSNKNRDVRLETPMPCGPRVWGRRRREASLLGVGLAALLKLCEGNLVLGPKPVQNGPRSNQRWRIL